MKIGKIRKILGAVTASVMILAMLPSTAMAAYNKLYLLSIGNISFADKTYEYGYTDTDYDLPGPGETFNNAGGRTQTGTWWLTNAGTADDPDYILTLNGAYISGGTPSDYAYGSYINAYGGKLTIVLAEGTTNRLGDPGANAREHAIYANCNEVVIEGDGTLNAYAESCVLNFQSPTIIRDGAMVNAYLSRTGTYDGNFHIAIIKGLTLDNASLHIEKLAGGTANEIIGLNVGGRSITLKNGAEFESYTYGGTEISCAFMTDANDLNNQIIIEGDEAEMYEGTQSPGTKVISLKVPWDDYGDLGTLPYVCLKSIMIPSVVMGDGDGDGVVTAKDKALLNRYLAGWPGYKEKIANMDAFDFDGDGNITAKDKAILNRYLAGWPGYDKYFQ